MSALNKFVSTPVPQTEQASPLQVKNNAGGYSFEVSDIKRLERFLIIGTDGGTYYVGEKDLTKQNVDFIRKMIAKDPRLVLKTVVEVSEQGRAYRNEAAIFVMALLLNEATAEFKASVVEAIPSVVRTATHAYQLAAFIEGLGGWGRAKRKAIAKWFQSKNSQELAYQAVKYRSRKVGDQTFTLRDLMRLSHPTNVDQSVGNFILGKPFSFETSQSIIDQFALMQEAKTSQEVVSLLQQAKNLPWETIPTQFLKDAEVWKTLFANGQLKGQALVRQITRLSRIGAFNDMVFARSVADALVDSDMIAKTRLHPIQYLLASVTHQEGQLDRDASSWYGPSRKKDWVTSPVIADALGEGFYKAFQAVTPANKRMMLALDVSGSMSQNALGIDLSCAQVSAAMAMVSARTEPYYMIRGFSTDFIELGISPGMSLNSVMAEMSNRTFGGTNCSLPMLWAAENRVEVDHFSIYTDNETWAGHIHPYKALEQYRQKMGIDAKLSVVGVAATKFTIANPADPAGMMDFVGFDTATPAVISDFAAGRL